MSKVTLTFNLPEEREQMDYALKGKDYYCVLSDYMERLSHTIRHSDNTTEVIDADLRQDELMAIMAKYNVEL